MLKNISKILIDFEGSHLHVRLVQKVRNCAIFETQIVQREPISKNFGKYKYFVKITAAV
jgi:hypothetical protein